MQFREGASVVTANGENVGTIDRVVINPETQEVSHLVVRQGFLFTEDRVLPIEMVETANADQVRLRAECDLEDLPLFEESYYASYEGVPGEPAYATTDYARPYYWYPPVGGAWVGYTPGYGSPATNHPLRTERNIPDGTVALKEGARVVDADGDQVGTIERIFIDDQTQQTTHLLISEGWLFTTKKVVPSNWIESVTDEEVQLNVKARFLERLPEHQAA
jgi:uncharacterized protein YrrD